MKQTTIFLSSLAGFLTAFFILFLSFYLVPFGIFSWLLFLADVLLLIIVNIQLKGGKENGT